MLDSLKKIFSFFINTHKRIIKILKFIDQWFFIKSCNIYLGWINFNKNVDRFVYDEYYRIKVLVSIIDFLLDMELQYDLIVDFIFKDTFKRLKKTFMRLREKFKSILCSFLQKFFGIKLEKITNSFAFRFFLHMLSWKSHLKPENQNNPEYDELVKFEEKYIIFTTKFMCYYTILAYLFSANFLSL